MALVGNGDLGQSGAMVPRRVRGATGVAAGAVALLLLVTGPVAAPGAGAASNGQPAFTTFEAPGGAATAGQRVIALTFDDGPGPYTLQVLSALERYQVPATFFEIGQEVADYPQYSKMVAAAGFPVEDHTWSHPNLITIPTSSVASQISMTQAEIQAVTGTTPQCVRPPYDAWNASVLSQIAATGLTTMSYSVDPRDWSLPGVQSIVNRVVGAACFQVPSSICTTAGGDRSETVAALPADHHPAPRAMGYTFVSICGAEPTYRPQVSATYAVRQRLGSRPACDVQPATGWCGGAADGGGYWEVAADGGIFSFGDAPSMGRWAAAAQRAIVGMAATADGGGYWVVAADGGIFSFGDAAFHGSMGGHAAERARGGDGGDADGGGYWLVASDGGIFSFGDAAFHGSMGGSP